MRCGSTRLSRGLIKLRSRSRLLSRFTGPGHGALALPARGAAHAGCTFDSSPRPICPSASLRTWLILHVLVRLLFVQVLVCLTCAVEPICPWCARLCHAGHKLVPHVSDRSGEGTDGDRRSAQNFRTLCACGFGASCQRLPAVLEEKSAKVCFEWFKDRADFVAGSFELASLHLHRRSQQFKYCNVLLVVGLPIVRQRDDKQPYEHVEGSRQPMVGTQQSWHVLKTRRRSIAVDGWRLSKREGGA